MAISRPGVEITQEFVTESTTVTAPSLVPVVIGPCYQVVEAINDSGDAVSDGLAGAYQDGKGYMSYDLPGLKTGAVVDTDSIRVFLFKGSDYTELNSVSDETTVTSGTTSTYAYSSGSTGTFTDSSGDFVTDGVEAGDVVRVSFQGLDYDLTISGTPAAKVLTVSAEIDDASITFSSYDIIRNPAQFAYKASAAQAAVSIGDETNYLTFTAQSTGNFAGQTGDDLSVVIAESEALDSGSNGVVGDYLFYTDDDSDKDFTSGVGSVGTVSDFGLYFDVPAEGDAAESTAIVVDVTSVISDNALGLNTSGIDDGEGVTAKNYRILQAVGSDSTDVTGGSEAVDASGSVSGFTSTDWSTVDTGLTGADYYLEISGDATAAANGVFHVASGDGAGTMTLSIGASMTATTGGGTYTLWKVVVDGSSDGDGNSGSLSMFAAPGLSFGSETVTDYDVLVAGTGRTVASVNSTTGVVTLSDVFASSADALDWSLVETSVDLSITYSADDKEVTFRLPRTDGVSTITYADLVTALTDDTDSNHDADSFVELTAAATGTGTLTTSDAATYALDGGVDAEGILVDADLLGSTTPTGYIYTSYKALRVDVSDQASEPALLSYDSISAITTAGTGLNPISTDNPLGLGMYLALLNSPNRTVKGLGISATSSAQPMGTTAAWATAADFLGGQDVYALAPLTDDPEVLAAMSTHASSYSAASEKAERIVFLSRAMPSYSSAEAIASGTTGNTEATFTSDGKFSTSVDFSANTKFTSAITDGDALVLVVTANAGSDKSPTLAAGAPTVLYGVGISDYDSSDSYVLDIKAADYAAADTDWNGLVDVAWTVYKIGTALSTTAQTASRVKDLGALYASRRSFLVWPPSCSATISGTTYSLAGYYMGAGWAGRVGSESPGQGFTNMAVSGFNDLSYSNGYFSESQLDTIAGGGTFIMIQESEGGAVTCRHQLATDVTTVQKRELSITKSVDYVAKTFRNAMTGKIGKFNITQSLMDSLSVQIQGLLRTFVDGGILTSGQLSSISQNSDNPDTLDITVILGVPYPCNYIALTLQI